MKNLIIIFINLLCKIIFIFYTKKKTVFVYTHNEFNNTFFFGNQSNNLSIIIDFINENSLFDQYTFKILESVNNNSEFLNCKKVASNIKILKYEHLDNLYFNLIKYNFILYYNIYTSKFIFSTNPYDRPFLKGYKQKLIVFNYYSPFKKDMVIKKPFCKIDFLFSSSEFFAEYIAKTINTDISKIINLGFPRLDTLLNKKYNKSAILRSLGINFSPSKILVYAPTHRNFWDKKFGSDSIDSVFILSNLLVDSDTVLIIFLHPETIMNISNNKLPDNIFIGSNTYPYSLYNFLAISDAIISDYSSLHFDYLCLDKPIFYFFKDYYEFLSIRGFVNDDFFELCKGPISYNSYELYSDLNDFLKKGIDLYNSERKNLNILVNNKKSSSYTKDNIEYLNKILK